MDKNKQRKCVGCGELKPRSDLIKLTKNHTNNEVILNPNSLIFGRSAYLCYNQNCIENAFKKNKINRVLKTNTQIDKEAVVKLLDE